MVKGCNQKKDIDFEEIFSSVVKTTSIRAILGLATKQDLEVEQLDVKTEFLHGDLEEEIYMEQPEGFGGSRNDAPQATENYYDMNQHLLKYCKLCCAQLGLCFVNFGILLLFFVQIKCNAVFLNNMKKEIVMILY